MIAEAGIPFEVPAVIIGSVLIAAATIAVSVNQIDDFIDRRKTKAGSPPNEQLKQTCDAIAEDVVRLEEELDDHKVHNNSQHDNLFKKIGGVERGSLARIDHTLEVCRAELKAAIDQGNISREKLHNRMNDLLGAIAKLQGKLEK